MREMSTSTYENSNGSDADDYKCNICLHLAQDPIVTLCGHLYCWPCIYKWLHIHSHSQICPICKARIKEEKLVPLYGIGKTPTDPSLQFVDGVTIPQRPAGRRPKTVPPDHRNAFGHHLLGFMDDFGPAMTAGFEANQAHEAHEQRAHHDKVLPISIFVIVSLLAIWPLSS